MGTSTETMSETVPILRPRPKLNPVAEGILTDMSDEERLILVAEMAGFNGRRQTDTAEALRKTRFDVQRSMALDLEDIKAGRLSTVWTEYGYPKPVRDVLGEEAYQSFVDDRLEAGMISHATAGLHLMQDGALQRIADGTTIPEAPHDKLAELMTPKVLAATAERARAILEMRRTNPSDSVLLSADLSQRKARFDAAFEAGETIDPDEMDAFLFYHEAAQREIGIAEAAIEMLPTSWARQVADWFDALPADTGTPTDRRAHAAELKLLNSALKDWFGPHTDAVIAYSLAWADEASSG